MAGKTAPKAAPVTANDEDVISNAPADWEFETVVEESATTVIFDTIGDVFIGQYVQVEHIDPGPDADGNDRAFDRYVFRGRNGELYALAQSYKLESAMEDVKPDTWVRITYVKDIPTGRKLNPMKDFRIEVKKN